MQCHQWNSFHWENVTQFICSIYANAHPDSCVKYERKGQAKPQNAADISFVSMNIKSQTTRTHWEPCHTPGAGLKWPKGLHHIHEHARYNRQTVIWYTFHMSNLPVTLMWPREDTQTADLSKHWCYMKLRDHTWWVMTVCLWSFVVLGRTGAEKL